MTSRYTGYHLGAVYARAVAFGFLLLTFLGPAGWAEEGALSFAKAEVSFALGVRAFEDGANEEAERHFVGAIGYNPQHGDALYWLGLTYLRLGRPADAVDRLKESRKAKEPPTSGRRRVMADLRIAQEADARGDTSPVLVEPPPFDPEIRFEKLPRWEAQAGLAALHDSNPGLLPEDLLFPLPGHALLEGATSDEAVDLDARIEFHPFYSRNWSLGVAMAGHQSIYQEQQDLDLSLIRGTVALAWGGSPTGSVHGPLGSTRVPTGHDRLSLLLQGGGAQVWIGDDSYLEFAEVACALIVRESGRTATRLELETRDSSYSLDGSDALRRGGTELIAGISQSLLLGRRGSSLRLGVAAGERQAGRAFDSSFHEALFELAVPLPAQGNLRVLGSWREDRFDHLESSLASGRPERDDTTRRLIVASMWPLKGRLAWTLRASHVRRDSNVRIGLGSPLFDYKRTTFSLRLDWRR